MHNQWLLVLLLHVNWQWRFVMGSEDESMSREEGVDSGVVICAKILSLHIVPTPSLLALIFSLHKSEETQAIRTCTEEERNFFPQASLMTHYYHHHWMQCTPC